MKGLRLLIVSLSTADLLVATARLQGASIRFAIEGG